MAQMSNAQVTNQVTNDNGSGNPPNPEAEALVARARLMMIISAVTTLIAIAAVVSVIGYRLLNTGGGALGADTLPPLPQGGPPLSSRRARRRGPGVTRLAA